MLCWEWGIWTVTILNHFHLQPTKVSGKKKYPCHSFSRNPLKNKNKTNSSIAFQTPARKRKNTAPPRQTKTEELPLVAVSSSLSISPLGKSKSNMRSAFGPQLVEKMWGISGWFLMEPLQNFKLRVDGTRFKGVRFQKWKNVSIKFKCNENS